jgi:hypothetical protein
MLLKMVTIATLAAASCLVPLARPAAQVTPGDPGGVEQQLLETSSAEEAREEGHAATERPTTKGEPTKVKIAIFVLDIDKIDSAEQNFSGSIYYAASWKNPALKHEGPGPQVRASSSVWTPRLVIINQQQAWNAFPSFVEIEPDGEVILRQKVWGWFSQPLNLHDFPFDEQTLSIHIAAAGLLQTDVEMIPGLGPHGRGSGIARDLSIPDFDVVSWNVEPRPYLPFEGEVGTAGFIMEIKLRRDASYYIWKLILPLCLIVAMSWVPRWLKPSEVGTSVGIAATSFLTLVAYLFAIAVLLPRVNYFTRMDQFILLATVMVFASLIQTVVTCSFARRPEFSWVERVNVWSRLVYPLILTALLLLAFVF